jgi:hypothetical protein
LLTVTSPLLFSILFILLTIPLMLPGKESGMPVERALGVEVQDDFTDELRGDRSQDQKGHTGGLTQKKDLFHLLLAPPMQ